MSARLVTKCDVCGNPNLRQVLSLGTSPPTCNMEKIGEPRPLTTHYPLDLMFCDDCTLAQLSVVVDPEIVFPPDYPYSSGHSRALHENFEDLARQASEYLTDRDDLVVDIGANDGTLLSKFQWGRTIGVEPTRQILRSDCDAAWQMPFSEEVAREIWDEYGPARVITACNVLAHVEDVDDVMRGVRLLLADDGVLIAENHDLASVVDGGQWDTIYHEHLRFYSPFSFAWLLRKHGMGVESWQSIPTHGGSFRMVARKGEPRYPSPERRRYWFSRLHLEATDARRNLRSNLADLVYPAYGIGATARATTVINYCGIDVEDLACVCEVSGSDKIGRLIPGTRIPVVDEARLFKDQPTHVVLFSWHMADVIVPKLREKGYEGEIIIPLPTLATA